MFKAKFLVISMLLFAVVMGCKKDDELDEKTSDPCDSVKKDVAILADFECQMDNLPMEDSTGAETKLLDNKALVMVDNPSKTGDKNINKSSHCGKFTDDGTNPWDNLFIGTFKTKLDLSTKNKLKIHYKTKVTNTGKTPAEKEVKIMAKLEGGTDTPKEILSDKIIKDDKWHELTFDFSDQASKNHKAVVLFFNAGKVLKDKDGKVLDKAKARSIFYVDNIRFTE